MYIAPGQGQTAPWGQKFDVNRKALSLYPDGQTADAYLPYKLTNEPSAQVS